MVDSNAPLWKVTRVTDTSKLEGGQYVDYRDIEIKLYNGDFVHVLIPMVDYDTDTVAKRIGDEVFNILDTLQLQSQQTVGSLPTSTVDLEGNVNRVFPQEDTTTTEY